MGALILGGRGNTAVNQHYLFPIKKKFIINPNHWVIEKEFTACSFPRSYQVPITQYLTGLKVQKQFFVGPFTGQGRGHTKIKVYQKLIEIFQFFKKFWIWHRILNTVFAKMDYQYRNILRH